ncbi:3-oxoacyl-[acyl-carrier-protein] synthase-3 [Amycolatopsis australiensis]|uniref:3-oxoacyl-[acyl-carrier-protein] synthase-3 n=1 Tax=Amycolatopsis australiensis TaxID=546364 RepID=A0A1K1RJX1_9PSEU|nr:3-oxoacyl-[acyl-carrier-protein] synthase-3 [Amycolatopsis australiensis]
MRVNDIYLAGVASWLPPREPIGEGRYAPGLQDEYAWESATVAGEDETVVGMAVRAGAAALTRSGVDPAEISLLLHAYTWFQGLDLWTASSYIHRELLAENRHARALDVNQQSAGGVSALQLAVDHLVADPDRRAAIVTTADRFSLPGLDRWHTEGPRFIFGDGGAAAVLARGRGFARVLGVGCVSDTTLEPMYRGDSEFTLFSPAAHGPIDLHARKLSFLRNRGDVRDVAERLNRGHVEAVQELLDELGLTIGEVDRFIFPNFGLSMLTDLAKSLGIQVSQTAWELGRTTGHVGAADPFTGLTHMLEQGELSVGDRVMLVGIGSGFFWSTALVECVEVPDWPSAA